MIKETITTVLQQLIKSNYKHIELPNCVYARVQYVTQSTANNTCVLKILDKNMLPDDRFAEIPKVQTTLNIKQGDCVAVILLYGLYSKPYILGRCD